MERWYSDEEKCIRELLVGVGKVRVHHIGSTAIEHIWAKPIVDILVEVETVGQMKEVKRILKNQEYLCMSESNTRISFNKGYTKHGFADRVFHIHIRQYGDHDELYFRDYMNERPELAQAYEKLKLSLWKKYEHNRDAYTDAKTSFVKEYTEQAKALYDKA